MKIIVHIWLALSSSWAPIGTATDGPTLVSLFELVRMRTMFMGGNPYVKLTGTTNGTDQIEVPRMTAADAELWWITRDLFQKDPADLTLEQEIDEALAARPTT